jgi:organic hydroperoxide reductase OsmC/OhrA
MTAYTATVTWNREDAVFTDKRYSRAHQWSFDGGAQVPASASPHVVPLPYSDPRGVDPEEAFVASISSCHMLWFLFLAAERGFRVDSYQDEARGELGKNTEGREAMLRVVLRPRIVFSGGKVPSADELDRLHKESHHRCFIANSVLTEVRVEPL